MCYVANWQGRDSRPGQLREAGSHTTEKMLMASHELQQAVTNNNDFYDEVFGAHGLEFSRTDNAWYTLQRALPLNSNIATRSADWQIDWVFRAIAERARQEAWASWSIKDSFAVLQLEQLGFQRLFDAKWIYLKAGEFKPLGSRARQLRYVVLTTPTLLAAWRAAWNNHEQGENLAETLYIDALLAYPRIKFIAGYDGPSMVSGCILNQSDEVLGISNFFPPNASSKCWADMVQFIQTEIKETGLVGYEQDDEILDGLTKLGFRAVGDLTVWINEGRLR